MDEPAEKSGLRTAWGRIAATYDDAWTARIAPFTERGLDLLDPPAGGRGLDVACGPGATTAALADRLAGGEALGVDFSPPMVERATAQVARPDVRFAVDDAEHLSLEGETFDVVTCSFGLMYCYDARAAMGHMARVLRPGGRVVNVVWGRAPSVWWVPVIELVETRAEYYSAVCPLMFFYGLPGVMERMLDEAGLERTAGETIDGRMRFPTPEDAAAAAIHATPVAGLYQNRLTPERQAEVREAMLAHVEAVAEPDGDAIALPAEVVVSVGRRPDGAAR